MSSNSHLLQCNMLLSGLYSLYFSSLSVMFMVSYSNANISNYITNGMPHLLQHFLYVSIKSSNDRHHRNEQICSFFQFVFQIFKGQEYTYHLIHKNSSNKLSYGLTPWMRLNMTMSPEIYDSKLGMAYQMDEARKWNK